MDFEIILMSLIAPPNGFFIVLEGIDGVGKTTQARMLVKYLEKHGHPSVYTTEPTKWSPYGKKLRESFFAPQRLPAKEEFSLFLKDRVVHVEKEIIPAMNDGKIVVCDRYYYSSAAYQGSRGLDWQMIIKENEKNVFPPNLVFLLDIPIHVAIERITNGRKEGINSFERRDSLEKVRHIYSKIYQEFSYLITLVDGTKSVTDIHEDIVKRVLQAIKKKD